jgi:hypothetical protein
MTDYYRAYFPDGSSALVGLSGARLTDVTLTEPSALAVAPDASSPPTSGGARVPVSISDYVFAAWGPAKKLDSARLAITTTTGGWDLNRTTSVVQLSRLPGTFDPVAFDAVCRLGLSAGITDPQYQNAPRYVGNYKPALKVTAGASVIWIYQGDVPYLCTYNDSLLQGATGLEPLSSSGPGEHYGITYVGPGTNDLAVGHVPLDVTDVQITGVDGASARAAVTGGLFTFTGSERYFDTSATVIVATSPTKIYKIANGTMTTTVR